MLRKFRLERKSDYEKLVIAQRLADMLEKFLSGRLAPLSIGVSLYTVLCKCLFSEVAVQAVTELDDKAAYCHAPVPQRHCPFL